jgi:hypothetical protein
MENDENELPEGLVRIPLDGSYGAGPIAEVTVITKEGDGRQKEETFTIPYLILDRLVLQKLCDINFILGFKVVKGERLNPALKELGL